MKVRPTTKAHKKLVVGMTFDPPTCPECGEPPRGTLETVQACAEFEKDDDDATPEGGYEFSGHTEVFWDSQVTVERNGKVVLVCPDGDEWEATKLTD